MGTLSHHQAQAHRFLCRADQAIAVRDHTSASVSLRRAATHVITALAIRQDWPHKSRRQLEMALYANIASANLSYSHLKTLRQVHTLSTEPPLPLRERAGACPVLDTGVRGILESPSNPKSKSHHPSHPVNPCQTQLRRLRRRVASLIKDVNALISGNPPPVHYHKLELRKPDFPVLPQLTYVQQILALPNYSEIQQKFRLAGVGMDTDPDPHGFYPRGDQPRRCPCHAHLWDKPRNPNRITLSPPWRHALEKTFRIKLPNPLILTL